MKKTDHKADICGEVTNSVKSTLNLDTILVEEIGQFGLYQLKSVLLASVVVVFAALVASEYVFSTARIGTRCFIPECELLEEAEFAPSWILNAIPGNSTSTFDNCLRFNNVSTGANSSISILASGTCPSTLFNQDNTVGCATYVYENTNTVVYDFDLACDEWRRSSIGTIRTLGTLVGLPLTGFVSDRWGRRTALTLNAFNTAWLGLARYWANSYIYFLAFEIMESALGCGGFSCAYILVMELFGPKYRIAACTVMNTFFALGQVILGLLAWRLKNWRSLTLAIYIPQLFTIFYFWLISESVRWLMSKGRYEESEKVLKEVARANGKHLSEISLQTLRKNVENEKAKTLKEERSNEPWLIVVVFQYKRILIRCLVSPIWWITTTFIYYGLSVNSVNMTGNQYLNYVAVCAVEIPGFWTAFVLIGKIGRKPVLIGSFWICAACQIGYVFLSSDQYAILLTVYLIGKYSIAMVMTTVYVYTNELYPTEFRHRLFAFSSTMGRIGAILAPLTPALGAATMSWIPFAVFASLALLSGALVFITPETNGYKFSDTMEEASNIGERNSKK